MGVPLEGIYLVVRSDCYDVIKKMIGGNRDQDWVTCQVKKN